GANEARCLRKSDHSRGCTPWAFCALRDTPAPRKTTERRAAMSWTSSSGQSIMTGTLRYGEGCASEIPKGCQRNLGIGVAADTARLRAHHAQSVYESAYAPSVPGAPD